MADTVFFPDDEPDFSVQTDDEGNVVVDLGKFRKKQEDDEDHYENLALEMEPSRLSGIASDLIDGIDADDRSRQSSLDTQVRALDLLGLERLDDQPYRASILNRWYMGTALNVVDLSRRPHH